MCSLVIVLLARYSRELRPYLGDMKINGIGDYNGYGWTEKIGGLYFQLNRYFFMATSGI